MDENEDCAFYCGLAWGALFSLPVWALIVWYLISRCL